MDLSIVIRERLMALGLEQKDLARAARVTESYVSQLLTRKRPPPAPDRTDIYERMDRFLRLPKGELAALAELERRAELKRELGEEPTPLFQEVRALILRKCHPARQADVRAIFERQPFGELERLVTQKLLDVVKTLSRSELTNDRWLRTVARLSSRSFEEMRVLVLEFLDTDVYHITREHCAAFLDPLLAQWDVDLGTLSLEFVMNNRVAAEPVRRFVFVESEAGRGVEPGFQQFLADASLSAGATAAELEFLGSLRFRDRRPTPLYYYRELQNLRDPLHFRAIGRRTAH